MRAQFYFSEFWQSLYSIFWSSFRDLGRCLLSDFLNVKVLLSDTLDHSTHLLQPVPSLPTLPRPALVFFLISLMFRCCQGVFVLHCYYSNLWNVHKTTKVTYPALNWHFNRRRIDINSNKFILIVPWKYNIIFMARGI